VALATRIVAGAEGGKISSLDAVGQLMTGKNARRVFTPQTLAGNKGYV